MLNVANRGLCVFLKCSLIPTCFKVGLMAIKKIIIVIHWEKSNKSLRRAPCFFLFYLVSKHKNEFRGERPRRHQGHFLPPFVISLVSKREKNLKILLSMRSRQLLRTLVDVGDLINSIRFWPLFLFWTVVTAQEFSQNRMPTTSLTWRSLIKLSFALMRQLKIIKGWIGVAKVSRFIFI